MDTDPIHFQRLCPSVIIYTSRTEGIQLNIKIDSQGVDGRGGIEGWMREGDLRGGKGRGELRGGRERRD